MADGAACGDALARVVLLWEGWRRSELARAHAVVLAEEAAALRAESRLIRKRVRADRRRRDAEQSAGEAEAVELAGRAERSADEAVEMPGDASGARSGGSRGAFRVFAVVRDAAALNRLERVFEAAPDRELVGVASDPQKALPLILERDVRSVYVDVGEPGADALIAQLSHSWAGFIRPFTLEPEQTIVDGMTVVAFDDLASVLESIYELKLKQGVEALSLDFQNLILNTLYQRHSDEAFLIMGYDGDVIFYAGRAARLGGLPYPPPAGLTEADVSHVIGRAYRRERVSSDDGRISAECFWIRLPRD